MLSLTYADNAQEEFNMSDSDNDKPSHNNKIRNLTNDIMGGIENLISENKISKEKTILPKYELENSIYEELFAEENDPHEANQKE